LIIQLTFVLVTFVYSIYKETKISLQTYLIYYSWRHYRTLAVLIYLLATSPTHRCVLSYRSGSF